MALFGSAGIFIVSLIGGHLKKPSDEGLAGIGSAGFGWGFWLAMLSMAAMTAGGWLMSQAKE